MTEIDALNEELKRLHSLLLLAEGKGAQTIFDRIVDLQEVLLTIAKQKNGIL